jgi:excisionase family DNA binding protein
MNGFSILTVQDVAKVLRISIALAYRLVSDGQLPGIKFNRTVRVRQEDLENFIQRNLTIPSKQNDGTNSLISNVGK